MTGFRILHISKKHLAKKLPVKDINTHGCKVTLWFLRFFFKFYDTACLICIHNAKTAGFFHWYFNDCNRCISMICFVVLKHFIVIHFVNMISGKNQEILRRIRIDKVDILGDRIGSSSVYIKSCICFLTRRKYVNSTILCIESPSSSCSSIPVEENRFILSEDTDNVNTTICTVAERKVNNTIFSTI